MAAAATSLCHATCALLLDRMLVLKVSFWILLFPPKDVAPLRLPSLALTLQRGLLQLCRSICSSSVSISWPSDARECKSGKEMVLCQCCEKHYCKSCVEHEYGYSCESWDEYTCYGCSEYEEGAYSCGKNVPLCSEHCLDEYWELKTNPVEEEDWFPLSAPWWQRKITEFFSPTRPLD